MRAEDSLLVSFVYNSEKDNTIMLVGRKSPNKVVEIVNAFQGKEAEELYKKLTTQKEKTKEPEEV